MTEAGMPARLSIRTLNWFAPERTTCAVAVSGPALTLAAAGPAEGSAEIVTPCAPVALAIEENVISAVPDM